MDPRPSPIISYALAVPPQSYRGIIIAAWLIILTACILPFVPTVPSDVMFYSAFGFLTAIAISTNLIRRRRLLAGLLLLLASIMASPVLIAGMFAMQSTGTMISAIPTPPAIPISPSPIPSTTPATQPATLPAPIP